jgi:hypothetical protein
MCIFGIEVEAVPTPDQRFKPSSAMVGFPSANLKDLTSSYLHTRLYRWSTRAISLISRSMPIP